MQNTHPLSTQPQPKTVETGLMWFRRDLRTHDNAALFYALKHSKHLHCVFVFDRDILDALPHKADRRVEFIWHSVLALKHTLQQAGIPLHVVYAHANTALPEWVKALGIEAVFCNKDYEPQARARDEQVAQALAPLDVPLYGFKDQCLFEAHEVLTQSGRYFSVFTPYKNACLKKLNAFYLSAYPSQAGLQQPRSAFTHNTPMPSLGDLGFEPTNLLQWIKTGVLEAEHALSDFLSRMAHYHTMRDFPAKKGVSYLSIHLRFGTVSIRQCARAAYQEAQMGGDGAAAWLNELIWRDFYFQLLFHRPDVAHQAFKPEFRHIEWDADEAALRRFKAWCEGQTGYPLVDAAQRQLNQTGWQHNRLRMITASFLTKDLGINWQWGEGYFAEHLNDFDLSANNGGWQWAASTGCDAQPYFRIFNPITQSEKFDPEGQFIRKYCPELAGLSKQHIHNPSACPPLELLAAGVVLGQNYPEPIVAHHVARQKTMARYELAKNKG